VSLGGFQNFNLLKMGHFRKYGVEDEFKTTALLREGQLHPIHFPEAVVDVTSIWDE